MSLRHRCCPHPLHWPLISSSPCSHTDLSPMISNIQKIAAPDPRSLRPHFPGGISTPRHAPAPSDGENILRDKDATRDSHLDIREPGERRQRHGRDGNKTLSFRGKHEKKVDSSGDSQCLSSRSSINIMKLARNIWIIVRHWGRPLSTEHSNVTVGDETRSWQFRIFRMSQRREKREGDCYLRRLLHCGSRRDPSPRHHYEIPKTFG